MTEGAKSKDNGIPPTGEGTSKVELKDMTMSGSVSVVKSSNVLQARYFYTAPRLYMSLRDITNLEPVRMVFILHSGTLFFFLITCARLASSSDLHVKNR